jgi:hypothetical protein
MTTLSSLKLTAAQKPTQMSAVQQRRNKLVKRLFEQMELAKGTANQVRITQRQSCVLLRTMKQDCESR